MARRTIILTAALGTLAFFATLAPAQSKYGLPLPPPPAPAEAPAGRTLNDDSLGTMLDDMGYQPERQKLPTGEVVFWFEVTHERVNYRVRACVCGRKVWLTTFVAQVTPGDKDQRQALEKLLEQNGVAVSKFEVWNGGKDLVLTRPLDNRAVTPLVLREELAGFMADTRAGHQAWDAAFAGGKPITRMPDPEVKTLKVPAIPEPKADEKRFAPDGGRFKIRMPGKPETKTIALKSDFGPSVLNLYRSANEREETSYVVGYADIPDAEARAIPEAQELDDACKGMVGSVKGKMVSNKAIKVAGYAGRDVTVETEGGIIRARVILVDQRLYQIMVVQGKDHLNPEAAQDYLDSFQLTR